jgi:DNA (cytosine-5)-methyltransferase 1
VFVVSSARNDICPAEILFEFEGVRRDTAPSGKKREKTSNGLENIVGALCARDYKGLSADNVSEGKAIIAYENHPADSRVKEMGDTCTTVTSRWETGGGNVPLVQQAIALAENTIGRQPHNGGNGNGFTEDGPMYTLNATGVHGIAHAYSFDSLASNSMKSSNPISGCNEVELSKTLDTSCLNPTANQGGVAVAHAFKVRGGCEGGGKGYLGQDEKAFTISTTQDQQIHHNMAVRRLTPIECERLQGFPDNYTNIKTNCPDGPRYKALGNSWAVPVVAWIGKRINDAIA